MVKEEQPLREAGEEESRVVVGAVEGGEQARSQPLHRGGKAVQFSATEGGGERKGAGVPYVTCLLREQVSGVRFPRVVPFMR